jgi:hypothetical protein
MIENMETSTKTFKQWLHTPCILGAASGLSSMLLTYIMNYPLFPHESCISHLIVPGLVSFLVVYLLANATKTMGKSQKQRFLIKFSVGCIAFLFIIRLLF